MNVHDKLQKVHVISDKSIGKWLKVKYIGLQDPFVPNELVVSQQFESHRV